MRPWLAFFALTAVAVAGDIAFSDPARQPAAPAGVGYPSRAPGLDVLPGFKSPPPGYGEVGFYWWLGDPLTKERLGWHLDQLAGHGISALQVNYAHSDKGGRAWGLTLESDPKLFSEPWWDLFGWFLKQARAKGMAVSLSDYTLGIPGQGWYADEIQREHPEIRGAVLTRQQHECKGPGECAFAFEPNALSVTAFRLDNGRIVPGSATSVTVRAPAGKLQWSAPAGDWRVVAVYPKVNPTSLDPMNPLSGREMIAKFFDRFEKRNPGESGKGLNFFFSDELSFGVKGWLWNDSFAREFQRRKGYDVVPELASIFEETGLRAVKVRLDYSDVMVALEEENYFRPLYEWHRSRGMLYGCDHGGRGRDVTEFGDYFRTQRWMTGPGNDQPGLRSDVIKNKVSSSITHLYERPRTWLEGYYGSGWGTTSAQVVDATWRNFAQGQNLLTLHGLYYSTHGGWWEWAPPCNHFHMPYWPHMEKFLHTVERMSYVLSQGVHRADVAILYPVAAVEANLGGKDAVAAAFDTGTQLYDRGIDFDFIDFESLDRAKVEGGRLSVSGESYRVLVIPAMRAVRHSTLEKAHAFARAGGEVVAVGALPEATERVGAGDPEVARLVRETFAKAESHAAVPADVERIVNASGPRDFVCPRAEGKSPQILHRRGGARDVYFVYGAESGTVCEFRATGKVELWNPWNGEVRPLAVESQSGGITRLRMPLEKTEAQLIVFSEGEPSIAGGEMRAPEVVPVEGEWRFEVKPSLDNRFGDYKLPASTAPIGAEARRVQYSVAQGAPSRAVTYTYGPRFWKLGPIAKGADTRALEAQMAAQAVLDETAAVTIAGKQYNWQPYEFSLRWSVEDDAGHQGYHGLKEEVPAEFIALGTMTRKSTTTVYAAEAAGTRYYLWTSVVAPRALAARVLEGGDARAAGWLNGAPLAPGAKTAQLRAGGNALLLRYDTPGTRHFLLQDAAAPEAWRQTEPIASEWFNRPGVLAFDTRAREAQPEGHYRFTAPPGMRAMTMVVRGTVEASVNGVPVKVDAGAARSDGAREYRVRLARTEDASATVELRVAHERGWYGGAALVEPIAFECGEGRIAAGDWSKIDGLSAYSGGAWYRKQITLTAAQLQRGVQLDLGAVAASVEVLVNGKPAATLVAPPWRVDVTRFAVAGENQIEMLVYNTLANHYQTIPTRYRGNPVSGLLGPVKLIVGGAR